MLRLKNKGNLSKRPKGQKVHTLSLFGLLSETTKMNVKIYIVYIMLCKYILYIYIKEWSYNGLLAESPKNGDCVDFWPFGLFKSFITQLWRLAAIALDFPNIWRLQAIFGASSFTVHY